MKTKQLILIVALFFPIMMFGQEDDDIPLNLKKLQITSNPVYVLLGSQPTNIIRPSTPRDFVVNILNNSPNGVLKSDLAIEFNPFLFTKDSVTKNLFLASNYFDTNIWNNIKKSFNISIASSATDSTLLGTFNKGTSLGAGFRFAIIPGNANEKTSKVYYNWHKYRFKENLIKSRMRKENGYNFDEMINKSKSIPENFKLKMKEDVQLTLNGLNSALIDNEALLNDSLKIFHSKKVESFIKLSNEQIPFAKDGFILEVAGSGMIHLQENLWEKCVFAKAGLWLTPSYRIDLSTPSKNNISSIDALGIIRYIWNNSRVDVGNYLDSGIKCQYNYNQFNISIEGIARYATNVPLTSISNWTYSTLMNLGYQITDDISFNFTFGNNFNGNTTTYSKPVGAIVMGGISYAILK